MQLIVRRSTITFQFNTGVHPPIVSLMDVDFSYNGQPVLSKVSLEIYSHDFIAVIGPNGGGKSTLLKLILGLIRPDRGSIRVLGGGREPILQPSVMCPRM